LIPDSYGLVSLPLSAPEPWVRERMTASKTGVTRTKGRPMFEELFQPMHLLVIVGIVLLVFGPKKSRS
jgi:hypothetical protein